MKPGCSKWTEKKPKPSTGFIDPNSSTTNSKKPLGQCNQSPGLLARKSLLKKLQKREMNKLRNVLPKNWRQKIGRRDDLALILGAAKYIGHLRKTLVARVKNGSLTPGMNFFSKFRIKVCFSSFYPINLFFGWNNAFYTFTIFLLPSCYHIKLKRHPDVSNHIFHNYSNLFYCSGQLCK